MATQQLAQGLASLGRNGDSVLVHMQPEEVAGLQSLAQSHGTSLTINPHTGYPEAFNLGGFFKKIIDPSSWAPMVAGALAAPATGGTSLLGTIGGMSGTSLAAGALTGAAIAGAKGDDPFLGAFSGGLGGGLGGNVGNALSQMGASTAVNPVTNMLPATDLSSASMMTNPAIQNPTAANLATAGGWTPPAADAAAATLQKPSQSGITSMMQAPSVQKATTPVIAPPSPTAGGYTPTTADLASNAPRGMLNTPVGFGGLSSGVPEATEVSRLGEMGRGISNFDWGSFSKAMGGQDKALMALGMPLAGAALEGLTPEQAEMEKEKAYRGLYLSGPKSFKPLRLASGGTIPTGGLMSLYNANDSQYGPPISQSGYGIGRLNTLAQEASTAQARQGFAEGGAPTLEDGGFVVPADVTFYAGGHSTAQGQQLFAQKYGGIPIRGPGTGLSDDIPTTIEGQQPARVADGEVYIPRQVVEQHGGTQKFYDMLDRVRKAAHGSTQQAKAPGIRALA